jgi:large repetitive protein
MLRGHSPHSVAVADFNDDNYPDLAVPNANSHTVSVLLQNLHLEANLSISKTASSSIRIGTNLTYEITVANGGPGDATDISVTDKLPPAVIFKSADAHGKGSYNNFTGDWSGFDLTAGSSANLTIVVKVNPTVPDGTIVTNIARVSGN